MAPILFPEKTPKLDHASLCRMCIAGLSQLIDCDSEWTVLKILRPTFPWSGKTIYVSDYIPVRAYYMREPLQITPQNEVFDKGLFPAMV